MRIEVAFVCVVMRSTDDYAFILLALCRTDPMRAPIPPPRIGGFTLVELMITVAIIAIITAVAVPTYTEYMVSARRMSAQAYLLSLASAQERFANTRYAYATTVADLGIPAPGDIAGFYEAVSMDVGAAGFILLLEPVAGGPQAAQGRLIVNSVGEAWRETDSSCTISTCALDASDEAFSASR